MQEMMGLWLHSMIKMMKHTETSEDANPEDVLRNVMGQGEAVVKETLEPATGDVRNDVRIQNEAQQFAIEGRQAPHISKPLCKNELPSGSCTYDGQKCPLSGLENSYLVCAHSGWLLMHCPPGTVYDQYKEVCDTTPEMFGKSFDNSLEERY